MGANDRFGIVSSINCFHSTVLKIISRFGRILLFSCFWTVALKICNFLNFSLCMKRHLTFSNRRDEKRERKKKKISGDRIYSICSNVWFLIIVATIISNGGSQTKLLKKRRRWLETSLPLKINATQWLILLWKCTLLRSSVWLEQTKVTNVNKKRR